MTFDYSNLSIASVLTTLALLVAKWLIQKISKKVKEVKTMTTLYKVLIKQDNKPPFETWTDNPDIAIKSLSDNMNADFDYTVIAKAKFSKAAIKALWGDSLTNTAEVVVNDYNKEGL